MHNARIPFSGLWLVALLICTACSETPRAPPPAAPTEALKEMAEVYKYIEYSKLPPPKTIGEFNQYQDSMMTAYEGIQKGDYVVVLGVGLSTSPASANQVLAYEKQAPTAGGAVLMRDGTVKQMTAAEFQSAPTAK